MTLSEALAGDPGFGGDVADRAAAVDTFTQSATTFRGQRSIRVGHRRVLSEFGALLGSYTPHPEDSASITSTSLSPTSRYRTASAHPGAPGSSAAPAGPSFWTCTIRDPVSRAFRTKRSTAA